MLNSQWKRSRRWVLFELINRRQVQEKGGTKIQVRVIEYTIDTGEGQQTYRLITSLLNIALFPALLLATEYHQRWEIENTIDELKTHLNGRKLHPLSNPVKSCKKFMVGCLDIMRALFNVHCRPASWSHYV